MQPFRENKKEIIDRLFRLLKETRAGHDIIAMEYETHGFAEHVLIYWESGFTDRVNISCDSGIAIMKDVLKAID